MTVQAGVELDWSLMVGGLPAQPCESPSHPSGRNHDGAATHYMRIGHECFGPVGQILSVCAPYVEHWQIALKESVYCVFCHQHLSPEQYNVPLGPITDYHH
jgi:hypothetical protein